MCGVYRFVLVAACVLAASLPLMSQAAPGSLQGTYWSVSLGELAGDCREAIQFLDGAPGAPDALRAGKCIGYINGYLVAFMVWASKGPAQFMCVPEKVSLGQIVRMFIKHADNKPERLHEAAGPELISAMMDAFFCTDKAGSKTAPSTSKPNQ